MQVTGEAWELASYISMVNDLYGQKITHPRGDDLSNVGITTTLKIGLFSLGVIKDNAPLGKITSNANPLW